MTEPIIPIDKTVELRTQVVDVMTGAFEMHVPLEVNVSSGDTWAAAKG